jgi:hypothetical protein
MALPDSHSPPPAFVDRRRRTEDVVAAPAPFTGVERRRSPGRRLSDRLPKIPCPACGGSVSNVISSRVVLSRAGVRRRRKCEDCGHRFTTLEQIYSPN